MCCAVRLSLLCTGKVCLFECAAINSYLAPTLPLALVKLRVFHGSFRPRLRLVGTDVPLVDVVIPCCNEALDVLQDTILAAVALYYPEDRFRVIVTDDGGSAQLRAWITEQGQHNLYYTARAKNGSAGFKAGNLNHAIRFIETQLTREPAEFIASLDADMIPEKKWLRAVIPHLVLNSNMGVVCPTQVSETRMMSYYLLLGFY